MLVENEGEMKNLHVIERENAKIVTIMLENLELKDEVEVEIQDKQEKIRFIIYFSHLVNTHKI